MLHLVHLTVGLVDAAAALRVDAVTDPVAARTNPLRSRTIALAAAVELLLLNPALVP